MPDLLSEIFNDFQGQVPETDVDGIDAKKSFLAKATNVLFENGFLRNAFALESVTLPTNVQSDLSNGYEFIDGCPFYHSKQGQQFLYVLWKENPIATVSFGKCTMAGTTGMTSASAFIQTDARVGRVIFVNGEYYTIVEWTNISNIVVDKIGTFTDEDAFYIELKERLHFRLGETLLDADEQDAGLEILDKPTKVNFNLVNDELKINLNCNARYYLLDKEVIFNLSLQYLEKVEYNATIRRDKGWYLCLRWLGNLYVDEKVKLITEAVTYFTYSFINNIIPPFIELAPGWDIYDNGGFDDLSSFRSSVPNYTKFTLNFNNMPNGIRRVKFWAKIDDGTGVLVITVHNSNVVLLSFNLTTEWQQIVLEYIPGSLFYGLIRVDLNFSYIPNPFDDPVVLKRFYVDLFEIIVESASQYLNGEYLLLNKYFNGERSLIKLFNVTDLTISSLELYTQVINWCVKNYELYYHNPDSGLWELYATFPIDNGWEENAGKYFRTRRLKDNETVETLNANYGLGESIRVDNQSLIYSECSYKNRVYFVKGDYRVYQSHIAGNGGIQPDSFPYDEDLQFGFFETSRAFHNTGLAVSVTNDLIVYSREGLNIYQIEANGQSVFKRLIFVSVEGLSNLLLLTRNIDGQPIMGGSLWANDSGIFIYPGGVTVPKNVVIQNYRNFWATIANNLNNGFGFFDKNRDEYWIKVNEVITEPSIYKTTFIIYELNFNQFRTYEVEGKRIEKLLGYIDNDFILKSEDTVITLSKTQLLGGTIETHLVEYDKHGYNNLLQEVSIDFVRAYTANDSVFAVSVYLDGFFLIYYVFSAQERIPIRLAPISSRFQKLKIVISLPSTAYYLSDFGFKYNKAGQRQIGMNSDFDEIGMYQSGYGYHYGKHYGVNIFR